MTKLQRAERDHEDALLRFRIAAGLVKVRKVGECPKRDRSLSLQVRRGGGTLPGHLDPRSM